MRNTWNILVVIFVLAAFLVVAEDDIDNEYDQDDRSEDKDEILSYVGLSNPFRMQKLNLVWEKARKTLAEGKLRGLHSELKVQDKEELTLKRLKAESGDKDGLREAEVRRNLSRILKSFGLVIDKDQQEDTSSGSSSNKKAGLPRDLFKDKKLNRLWEKAEKSGLAEEELMALKQEFRHHQEKVEQYNQLLEASASAANTLGNHLDSDDDPLASEGNEKKALGGSQKEVKESYERLHRLATNTHAKEFEEQKVEALWNLARGADFTAEELESLRTELHHFETRLQKLHYLETELGMVDERHGGKLSAADDLDDEREKSEGRKIMDKKVKKHMETVEKMERHLERTIAGRHSEL